MSTIVVLTTGGTIAMLRDEALGGNVPAIGGSLLVEAVPELSALAESRTTLEVLDVSNIPSSRMTPSMMLDLARTTVACLERPDIAGAVITHGTDTLEESAFFLDCFLGSDKPVCFAGAMRSGSDPGPDGPYNLVSAVRVASSKKARGHGVLVVMNGEIHAARRVTKTHTASVAAFASPGWGPLGLVDEDDILLGPPLPRLPVLRPAVFEARAPIIKVYTGMDAGLLEAVHAQKPDGLILEAFGRGNIPDSVVPALMPYLDDGIPVVVSTRVPAGRTLAVYAFDGGAAHLHKLGVILSGSLNSQKARILLMLAASSSLDRDRIAALFTGMDS